MAATPSAVPAPLAPREGRLLSNAEVCRDAAGNLALCAAKCDACGCKVFPPSDTCPSCLSGAVNPFPITSAGTLYSYTTVHIAPKTWQTPYVVGYVDFPEGVRVFGKVDGVAERLRPDMTVSCVVEEVEVPGKPAAYRYCFVPA